MTITKYDDIIASRAAGKAEDVFWCKTTSITPAAANNWLSLINSAGSPAARTASGGNNGAIMTNSNSGAIPITSPGASDQKYFLTAGVNVSHAGGFSALLLIDVLWLMNFSVASSPGNITSPTWTRYTDGKGLQIGCAVTTTLSSITPTLTVTYNAPEGNGHTCTTGAFASALAAPKMMPLTTPFMPLASGDTGVTAISNVTISATGTGNIDVFVYKPIAYIPTVAANTYIERDTTLQIDGITLLPKDSNSPYATSCLAFLALGGGTSACATQSGFIRTCSG